MTIQFNKKITLILLLIIGTIIFLVFQTQSDHSTRFPYYPSEYNASGSYKINPYTIIESLGGGNGNVFMPVLATAGPDDLLATGSVSWTQSDYLKIAQTLFEFLWKESLDDWNIHSVGFDKDCENNQIGFDRADISLYKVHDREYILRTVAIYPLASEVDWGGETAIPRPLLSGWKSIDFARMNITADDALRMAEEYGGKEARLSNKNDCRINVSISGSKNDYRWKVSYYYTPSFDLLINPFSGKYEILK